MRDETKKWLEYAAENLQVSKISRSSIAETISHCYVALDQNYINNSELSTAKDMADRTWKRINKFISYLKTNKPTNQATNKPTNQPTNQQTN